MARPKMNILDRKFSHRIWFLGENMTNRDFLNWASKIDSDMVLHNGRLVSSRGSKKLSDEEIEYFSIERENNIKEHEEKQRIYKENLDKFCETEKIFIDNILSDVYSSLDYDIRHAQSNLNSFIRTKDSGEEVDYDIDELIGYWEEELLVCRNRYINIHKEKLEKNIFGVFTINEVDLFIKDFVEKESVHNPSRYHGERCLILDKDWLYKNYNRK